MCAGWGSDNKAMCCSVVRFIAVLFALVASVCRRGERLREGGTREADTKEVSLGEEAESEATLVVDEAGACLVPSNKTSNLWCLFSFSDAIRVIFLSKKTESMIVLV